MGDNGAFQALRTVKSKQGRGIWVKIAQVAPLYESVPPAQYGGTERVVAWLTEELVRLGHDVTLFASGDSKTSARLISPCVRSLRTDPDCRDKLAPHMLLLEQVFQQAQNFDVIHFHIDYLHYCISRRQEMPHITTLHGRLDTPQLAPLYREFRDIPLVSISDAQREPLPWANWQATVYHGLPPDLHTFRPPAGRYLAFLGRISPEKRVDRAIEIAKRCGLPLKVAAKVDHDDREYFEAEVRPLLDDPLVEFLGEVGGKAKDEFLGKAYALLFPIDWPEPFGLVMIEAMACGTPVIACRCGSVPEIIDEGVTGFVLDNWEDCADAVGRVSGLCRRRCRETFERRFTSARMAEDYLKVYERAIALQRRSAKTYRSVG
jgi:glycosyltransferase involved in cell wall biosynthesis